MHRSGQQGASNGDDGDQCIVHKRNHNKKCLSPTSFSSALHFEQAKAGVGCVMVSA
jgi:hypothetical protein